MFYKVIKTLTSFILAIIAPTKVIGMENIKDRKGFILTCNHQTNYDVPLLIVHLKQELHFMAKEELLNKSKLVKWFLNKMNTFSVKRGTADLSAIKRAVDIIKQEGVLAIFPQGTRVKTSSYIDRQTVFGGVGMIAIRAKCNIIPAMFSAPPALFKRNTLLIGKMIDLSQFYDKKISNETIETITDLFTTGMNDLLNNYLNKSTGV